METIFKTLPSIAYILSGGSMARIGILYAQLISFYVRTRFGREVNDRFFFSYLNCKFVLHLHSLIDIDILDEVFLTKQYIWPISGAVKTIIDIGAHSGESAVFYHSRYPEAKVYAIEPDPTNYARLLENTKSISSIIPIQVAVSDMVGEAEFFVTNSSMGHSLRKRNTSLGSTTVPTTDLPGLLSLCGIASADLIKFDIEGAEDMLFKNTRPEDFARAYIGEFHGDLTDLNIDQFKSLFSAFVVKTTTPFTTRDRYMIKAFIKD